MTDATSPDPVALVERLLKVESGNADFVTGLCTNWHRNPEGPEAADLIERQAATLEAMASALEPFARYLDVIETMGGNTPRTGTYCGVSSSSMGDAEITIEDMKEARTTLTQYRRGDL